MIATVQHRVCRACVRLARPGDLFCSHACELAFLHAHETRHQVPAVLEAEAGKVNDGRLYVGGLRLPLQNSA